MESGSSSTMVTLKCPILNCAWQYESGFDAERSFLLISMHVEKDHAVPSNYADNQSPISSCKRRSKATVVSLARKQAPMPTEHIQCPKCKAPFRKFNGRNIRAFKHCMKCFQDEKKRPDNISLCETDYGTKAGTVSTSLLGIHDNSMLCDHIASDLCRIRRNTSESCANIAVTIIVMVTYMGETFWGLRPRFF